MKYRVIYLEDEEGLLALMKSYFKRKADFELITYSSLTYFPLWKKNSICECQSSCADFLITDNSMPLVNGLDFLRHIHTCNCKIPHVLMTSGWDKDDLEKNVLDLGYNFLHKPFSLVTLGLWFDSKKESIPKDRVLIDL